MHSQEYIDIYENEAQDQARDIICQKRMEN